MFTLFLTKLKTLLFGNLSSIFVVGLVAIIAVVVVFNADTVLSKLGMETRSTLTAKLAKTEQQLQAAVATNKDLNKTIEELKKITTTQVTTVEANCREAQEIYNVINGGTSTLDQKAQAIKKAPRKASVASKTQPATQGAVVANTPSEDVLVLQMTNHLSPEQLNELSQANITAINTTYATLFKKA